MFVNWLEEGYIPHPNDKNVLAGVDKKLHHSLDQVESQNNETEVHDQSLLTQMGEPLISMSSKCFITSVISGCQNRYQI